MSNMLEYAKNELKSMRDGDSMNEAMCDHIEHMVEEFSKEGHSGFSAAYAIGILEKLLRYEPITPLTGEEDEWYEPMEDIWQNKRCSRVFKNSKDGQAYDMDAVVFREPDGCCYTSYESRKFITFPYTPTTEVVDREFEPVYTGDE